jgi:ankyrin repeat protein
MNGTPTSLSDRYYKAISAVLFISLILFVVYFFRATIAIPWFTLPNPKDTITVTAALLIVALVNQSIQWRQCPKRVQVKYGAQAAHLISYSLAFIALYLTYPAISVDTVYQGISFWWYIPFVVLGLVTGFFGSIVALATLLIRPKEEAQTLGLPTISVATICQYKAWFPVIVLLIAGYFLLQHYTPPQIKAIGALLFCLGFLKEMAEGIMGFYLSQDEKGNRIAFRERVKNLRNAFNKLDYSRLVAAGDDILKLGIFEGKNTPQEIQKQMQKLYAPPSEKAELPKFRGKFLGARSDGNLDIEITFNDSTIPTQRLLVPKEYVDQALDIYLKANPFKTPEDMEKAMSHAFNQATVRVWGEQPRPELSTLNAAILGRQYDAVKKQLELQETDLNTLDFGGWTPLLHASAQGFTEIMELLLDKAANPDIANIQGITPLHYGARYDNYQVCTLLLNHGANPNLQDQNGWTPLMVATRCGNVKNVEAFLTAGADARIISHEGQTALDIAQQWKYGQVAKLIRRHLKNTLDTR